MKCTKTGCQVFIAEYDEYVWGDAFEVGGIALFRIVVRSREPFAANLHYTVFSTDQWFDKDRADVPASTLISSVFTNHGYEGIPPKG